MNFAELSQLLDNNSGGGRLSLNAGHFSGYPLADYLNFLFPEGEFELSGANRSNASSNPSRGRNNNRGRGRGRSAAEEPATVPAEEKATYRGNFDWGGATFRVSVDFFIVEAAPQMRLVSENIPNRFTLQEVFPELDNNITGNTHFLTPALKLDSSDPLYLPANFREIPGFDQNLFADPGKIPAFDFSGAVDLTDQSTFWSLLGSEAGRVSGSVVKWQDTPMVRLSSLEPGSFTIGNLTFSLSMDLVATSWNLEVQDTWSLMRNGYLDWEASLGSGSEALSFKVTVYNWEENLLNLELKDEHKGGGLNLSGLATLLGQNDLANGINAAFPHLNDLKLDGLSVLFSVQDKEVMNISVHLAMGLNMTIVPDLLSVDEVGGTLSVDFPFDTNGKRSTFGWLEGKFTFAEAGFSIILNTSTLNYDLRLIQDQFLTLNNLGAALFGIRDIQQDLSLRLFQANGTLGSSDLFLYGALETNWNVLDLIEISDVDFILSRKMEAQQLHSELSIKSSLEIAGVGMELSCTRNSVAGDSGWEFKGTLAPDASVPVGDLISWIAGKLELSAPEGLTNLAVNELYVEFNTKTKYFEFKGQVDTQVTLPFANSTLELDVKAHIIATQDPKTGQKKLYYSLGGDVQIGDATFSIIYEKGTEVHRLRGTWLGAAATSLSFENIADALGIPHQLAPDAGLDLGMKKATFEYDIKNERFLLSAESDAFGEAFFIADEDETLGWGFVFGLDFNRDTQLNLLPEIGTVLEKVREALHIEQGAILLATRKIDNFQIPDLPAIALVPPAPTGSGQGAGSIRPITQQTTMQLTRGISLAAVIDLSNTQSAQPAQNIGSLVSDPRLVLQMTYDTAQIRAFIGLPGNISIPDPRGGTLNLSQAGIAISYSRTLPEITFQAYGDIAFQWEGKMIDAKATLSVSDAFAQVAFFIRSETGSLPVPSVFKGLHLIDFGLEMGVFFEPPGIDLGIQGSVRIGPNPNTEPDKFALVLEMVGVVPNPLYLSFYVPELNMRTLTEIFTDKDDEDVLNDFDNVDVRDLSFYWSEEIVTLPDGTLSQPGIGFSGTFDIFSFQFHGDLEVRTDLGVHGLIESDPVNLLNVVKVKGDGSGITRKEAFKDGSWVTVKNNEVLSERPPLQTRDVIEVSPDGPVLEVSSTNSPYLHLSFDLSFMDLVEERIQVEINEHGITFEEDFDVAGIETFTLRMSFADWDTFSAGAAIEVELPAHLPLTNPTDEFMGNLSLGSGLSGSIDISISPQGFRAEIQGSFEIAGNRVNMPSLVITTPFGSFSELPGLILSHILHHLWDLVEGFFGSDGRGWIDWIIQGIIFGSFPIAGLLQGFFGVDITGVAGQLLRLGFSPNDIASNLMPLFGPSPQQLASVLNGLGISGQDIAGALMGSFGRNADLVASALEGIGIDVRGVADILNATGFFSDNVINDALHFAGFDAGAIGGVMGDIFGGSWIPHVDIIPHVDHFDIGL